MANRPTRAEHETQCRLGMRISDALQAFALRFQDLLGALGLDQEPFVDGSGFDVRRISRVRLRQNAFVLTRRKALGDPRGADERIGLGCSRRRLVRGAQQLADTVLPICGAGLHVCQTLACVGRLALGALQRFGICLRRAVVVTGVAQHVAELTEQRDARRAILCALQLQLEQLLNHVQLAELPVDAARFAERFDQRWVELERVLKVLEGANTLQELPVQQAPKP